MKFTIRNQTNASDLIVEIAQPSLDYVAFFYLGGDKEWRAIKYGEAFPFYSRKYDYKNFMFDISIPPNATKTFFAKVKNGDPINIPVFLAAPSPLQNAHLTNYLFFGFYFGVILVMVLYNLFIYFSIRDKSYLFYVLYFFLVGLTQAIMQGYANKYFWPNSPWLATRALYFSGALVGVATIFYVREFLQTRKYMPKSDLIFNILLALEIVGIILCIVGAFNLSYRVIDLNAGLGAIFVMFIAIKISYRGYRPAKFFLVGSSIFLISVIIYILITSGYLNFHNITPYVMPIGSSIEAILLSFALADRINILKKENEFKQNEIIEHLKLKEQYLLAWKDASINAEKLKKENIEVQYESLKNQVNPHFLFNSLNVLTELLYQDQDQAAEFVKELSQVYRYLLENKDKEIVSLETELDFIEAFIFLLKIRFDKSLIVNINLEADSETMIAPLTLQLLLENAIKHNVVSSEDPLRIDLYEDDTYIVISNIIQRKNSSGLSSGIGLRNITERYGFLTNKKVEIIAGPKDFTVKIPKILAPELVY